MSADGIEYGQSNVNGHDIHDIHDLSFLGHLSDDIFDSDFTFLDNDTATIATTNGSNPSSPSDIMLPPQPKQDTESMEDMQAITITPKSASPPHSAKSGVIDAIVPSQAGPYPFPVIYSMSTPMVDAQAVYHLQNGPYTDSPTKPPSMLSSPHSSLGSHRFSFDAASAFSPAIVTPHSKFTSQLIDQSPSHGPDFSLPSVYSGTPLTSVVSLADDSPQRSLLPGLHYASYVTPQSGPIRNKGGFRSKSSRNIINDMPFEDDDADLSDDDDDLMAEGILGLTSSKSNKRCLNLTDAEKSRKRVVGEKMRRDRLREAFNRVQAVLPDRPLEGRDRSKKAVLDRAVTHISHIQIENHHLRRELVELKGKYAKLQAVLEEGFLAGATTRPASQSPTETKRG